jgi:enterochelin esterase-like enzyme
MIISNNMKRLLFCFFVLTVSSHLVAQIGQVSDNLSMYSKVLKMDRKYSIYFPPDYETSMRSYPVLYLLHGMGDDQSGWVQFGEVLNIADKAINSGAATSMIIVMPDANTGKCGYVNDITEEWLYENFFFQEFMPFIERSYPIRAEKTYRAVAGLSMGGEGTFIYALHHPELFSSACPLSAPTGTRNIEEFENYWLLEGVEEVSKYDLKSYFERYSVINMIENMPDDQISAVRWYIDCGDDDFDKYEYNSQVHIAMSKREIPHEFRIRDGRHNWTYWRASLPEVLKFVSVSFHQP